MNIGTMGFAITALTAAFICDVSAQTNGDVKPSNNVGLKSQGKTNNNLGSVSQEQQLKLQNNMDQRSKVLETTSNVMKKKSDSNKGIIQNMK